MSIFKKKINEFPTPYTCKNAVKKGGVETKLSMILMGFGTLYMVRLSKDFCIWQLKLPTSSLWQ